MKVEAKIKFQDGSGRWREPGEQWIIGCKECALSLEKSGKVKIIDKRPK